MRHGGRRGPGRRQSAGVRRSALRVLGGQGRLHAPHARPDRRRDDRSPRPARICADPADPRAAHPPGEGDVEHHDESDPARARRADHAVLARPAGLARAGGDLHGPRRVREGPLAGRRVRSGVSRADNVQGVCRPRRTARARGGRLGARVRRPPGVRAGARLRRTRRRAARRGHREADAGGRRPAGGVAARVKLVFEKSRPGRRASALPRVELPAPEVPDGLRRARPPRLPELSEPEVVRHFTELTTRNYGIDTGFYPLGSCTMKYNPRVNERVVALPGFRDLHPLQGEDGAQGALELMWRLQEILAEVAGLPAVSLQPAAGSQGELTGLFLMRAHFAARGEGEQRDTVITADTAHGTNPASVAMAGYRLAKAETDARGNLDVEHLRELVSERTAGLMLTNPSTLGLFDEHIEEVAQIFHDAGALLYYDGANLNAVCGISRPGDMGFDIVHYNLHKTFSQPHGGGGPGGGPVAVRAELEPYLPVPAVARDGDRFRLDFDRPQSIGKVRGFYGPFGVFVRSYAYIRSYGAQLREMSEVAVLNANYLLARLRDVYELPFDRLCMHEFVLSARGLKRAHGVTALDVAKRLMDFGFHPPTIYFPLIVPEALMIEPTETETKETLDAFADALIAIAREAGERPEELKGAPHGRPVGRLDEVKAAKRAIVKYGFDEHPDLAAGPAAAVEAPKGV
ncbi:MAG: aminomethyl-transferring glycine dehydrogenase subunit GcvPB [Thermoleophilia bacterium]|nr:aminomethyl-transferring glycine dehydrogenase subunit GcvPB [Thermoleophilia bacterium]